METNTSCIRDKINLINKSNNVFCPISKPQSSLLSSFSLKRLDIKTDRFLYECNLICSNVTESICSLNWLVQLSTTTLRRQALTDLNPKIILIVFYKSKRWISSFQRYISAKDVLLCSCLFRPKITTDIHIL